MKQRHQTAKQLKQKSSSSKKSMTHKVGDTIERAGKKLQDVGAKKTGQSVYNMGNKIEHSQDRR